MEFPGLFLPVAASLTARMREREIKGRRMEKTGLSESMQAARNVTKMFLFFWYDREKTGGGDYGGVNWRLRITMRRPIGIARWGSRMDDKWSDKMNHTPTNIEEIAAVIDYIEEHLMEERLDLESIAVAFNYSDTICTACLHLLPVFPCIPIL